ncbi:adipolin isoform X3 [Sminthopsis crassicaudata]|uniref:adipolin isoform X3 n=1 Tax=Sminthopsis crassicaudata TaxID=9301 RepID=UPI003D68D8B9
MRLWVCAVAAALLWQHLALLGGAGAKRERKKAKEPSQYTEPFNATLSNSEELPAHPKPPEGPGPELSDAHKTWLNFVRRPDEGAPRKKCKGKDKRLRGLVGPPGPPGPAGPPGPPGAEVTQEALLQEFKDMLKVFPTEATERRAAMAASAQPSQRPLDSIVVPYRRVEEAFHCKLKAQLVIDKKTLMELHGFQAPLAKGAFLRGSGLNLSTGRFTAPVSGIYQFSANVHIDHSELKSRAQLRARDNVRVLICIESLCHQHTSLEVITGLESNSKIFTVHIQGLLQLQAGQYTSIFVDNSAGAALTIQSGSDFMGMLVGL